MATEFIWQSADSATVIHVSLDLVDGILNECMRGLGAVPKRGAEVGGVLLGNVSHEGPVRHIVLDAFEAVPIEYKHGPSYLFSEDDAHLFAETMARLNSGQPQPVGFFRANTRDEMELTAEDVDTLNRHFRAPDALALLIRPYSTRPSMAGFVLPEGGGFQAGAAPADEFLFRRREIEETLEAQSAQAGPRVPYRPFAVPVTPSKPEPAPPPTPAPAHVSPVVAARQASAARPAPQPVAAPAPKRRVWWSMLPLSSMFLAVGILLGIQATLALRGVPADPWDLRLSLSGNASGVTLRWDQRATAVQAAKRGTVFIEDGLVKITRNLEAAELHGGSIVYIPTTSAVHFRLEVFPREHDSVTETIDWTR
ncbi:MAG TPA: hypothetical protein VMJ34_15355 [Bryobacteraceae bacterium]|nr:hypothetical protein [Bryobacteraceae bacterium]